MSEPVLIGAVLLGALALLDQAKEKIHSVLPNNKVGQTFQSVEKTKGNYDDLYKYHSAGASFDWKLLKAIAIVESNERPNAENPVDPSYGICQILCRPDGQGGCSNCLNVSGFPPENYKELFDPDYNIWIASQILDWNIRTFGTRQGVAVYNSWTARKNDRNGPFVNQAYVDKVFDVYGGLT